MNISAASLVAFDTETHLIQPGLLAPPLVCASVAVGEFAGLLDKNGARITFADALRNGSVIVGANIAYDMGVMLADAERRDPEAAFALRCDVFKAYREGRVYDVQIAQALDAIARGCLGLDPDTKAPLTNPKTGKQTNRYSLDLCVRFTLGRDDAKAHDFWRERYAILDHVPMDEWPEEALTYPVDDARNTLEVARAQLGLIPQRKHEWGGGTNGDQCRHCGVVLTFADPPPCVERPRTPFLNLRDQAETARAAFALHLGALWGLRTDPERVEALETLAQANRAKVIERFAGLGFLYFNDKDQTWKEDGSAVKKEVAIAYGVDPMSTCPTCGGAGEGPFGKENKKGKRNTVGCTPRNLGKGSVHCGGTGLDLSTGKVPRSEGDDITANRDALMESGDEDLHEYGDSDESKILETYLPFLEQGIDQPINLRPNAVVATLRTSYDGVIQLLPRAGGVRECIVPREGMVFCSTDYAAGELCTLAQVCLWVVGRSKMAELINASGDPGALHSSFGAKMLGSSVDEFKARIKAKDEQAKGFRQAAKAANFGFPGGMGAAKFVITKRKKIEGSTTGPDGRVYAGLRFCILIGGAQRCGEVKITEWKRREYPPICKKCVELAEGLRADWLAFFDEVPRYFEWVNSNVEGNGEVPLFDPTVEGDEQSVRGGVDFTNGSNNGFQSLLARGAKRGLTLLTDEAYTDRSSVLFGTRPIFFAHDDVISEMREETAHLAGPRQAELMVQGLKQFVPDVAVVCEPALMRAFSKGAETVYDASGRLLVWEPKP